LVGYFGEEIGWWAGRGLIGVDGVEDTGDDVVEGVRFVVPGVALFPEESVAPLVTCPGSNNGAFV
jgi:hypothetical protein